MNDEVPTPLKRVLVDPMSRIDSEAVLRNLRERERRAAKQSRPRAAIVPRLVLALGLVGAGIFAWRTFFTASPEPPLTSLDLPASATEPRVIETADGSQLQVSPGTRGELRVGGARSVDVTLGIGRVRFSVNHEAHRAWTVHSGPTDVHVIGTVFTVDRGTGRSTRVDVERGIVLVRAAALPGGFVNLHAGEELVLADGPAPRQWRSRSGTPRPGP